MGVVANAPRERHLGPSRLHRSTADALPSRLKVL